MYEINAQLLVNDVDVKIKSFQYQRPTGKLGSILNIELAKDDPNQIPLGASIDFNLIFNGTSTYALMSNGKIQDRASVISYGASPSGGKSQNKVTFTTLDVMSDRFTLAPRRPVTMFDPSRVKYDEVYTRSDQQIRDESFGRIQPIIEPVGGLSMSTILRRAYTGAGGFGFITAGITFPSSMIPLRSNEGNDQQGCGFDNVITNIEDFLVRRADFTIEGGWHDGAQPAVAMYDPTYTVLGNNLFILYMDRALPHGISAYVVPIWKHKNLTEQVNFRPEANAILLTYQYNANDPFEDAGSFKTHRDVFHDEVTDQSSVLAGQLGYYKTTVRRWDREFFMSDVPGDTLDTLPLSTKTSTEQTVKFVSPEGATLHVFTVTSHEETIDYQYEGDLKVGHTRETKVSLANGNNHFLQELVVAERETCRQSWVEDPNNPGTKLLDRVLIDIEGRCYYDTENLEQDEAGNNVVRYLPALLAQRSGVLGDSYHLTDLMPVKTIRQQLQNMKGGQLDMEVIEIDHLNGTIHRSYVQPTTGDKNNNQFATRTRQVLIVDEDSVTEIGFRVPIGFNAYELPRQRAMDLARQHLVRLKHPLMSMPIEFNGIDLAVIQGSVIKGERRDGTFTSNYFVTGYEYNGVNLGQEGHRISQSCEGIELLALS